MKRFKVKWKAQFEKILDARDKDEALDIVSKLNSPCDGNYIDGSWEILKVEEAKYARKNRKGRYF